MKRECCPHPHIDDSQSVVLIRGTRVPVHRLWAWYHRHDLPVTTIMKRYGQFSPAQVLTALSYAYSHQDEMNELLDEEQRKLKVLR